MALAYDDLMLSMSLDLLTTFRTCW